MSSRTIARHCRVFAADLQALRPRPSPAAWAAQPAAGSSPHSGVVASPPRTRLQPRPGRLLPALLPRRCRRRPRHPAHAPTVAHGSLRPRWTTRSSCLTARGFQRQLPRGSRGLRARLPGHRRGRPRLDRERRTDRLLDGARSHGLPPFLADDPASTRPHDRAVHLGRDRLRDQAARRPGVRRLHPVLGDAGGPRLDGLVRGPQAATIPRRTARVLAIEVLTAARPSTSAPPCEPAAGDRRRRRLLRAPASKAPDPDRFLTPDLETRRGRPYGAGTGHVRRQYS